MWSWGGGGEERGEERGRVMCYLGVLKVSADEGNPVLQCYVHLILVWGTTEGGGDEREGEEVQVRGAGGSVYNNITHNVHTVMSSFYRMC